MRSRRFVALAAPMATFSTAVLQLYGAVSVVIGTASPGAMSTLMLAPAARWVTVRPVATPGRNKLSQPARPALKVSGGVVHE